MVFFPYLGFFMFLSRYLHRHLLKNFFLITLIPLGLIWIIQMRQFMDVGFYDVGSLKIFAQLSLLTIPKILIHLIPLTFAGSMMYVFYGLWQSREITILWATGMKPRFFYKIVFLQSLGVGLFLLLMYFIVMPQSEKAFSEKMLGIRNNLVSFLLRPNSFVSPNDKTTIYIQKMEYGAKLEGFFLRDTSNPEGERIMTAETAILGKKGGGKTLYLQNGQMVFIPYHRKEAPSRVVFDKFTLNLQMLNQYFPKQKLHTSLDETSFLDLIKRLQKTSTRQRNQIYAHIHHVFVMGMMPFLYGMIVILFMIKPLPPREFPKTLIIYNVLAILSIHLMMRVFHNIILEKHAPSFYFYIIPIIVISGFIFFLTKKNQTA